MRTFLSAFAEEFDKAVLIQDQHRIAHKAWTGLLDVARADLLDEPREIEPAAKGPTA